MKEAPLVGAFFIVDFIRSHAGNFPPYHGGAPDAIADGMAGEEPSMSRIRTAKNAPPDIIAMSMLISRFASCPVSLKPYG